MYECNLRKPTSIDLEEKIKKEKERIQTVIGLFRSTNEETSFMEKKIVVIDALVSAAKTELQDKYTPRNFLGFLYNVYNYTLMPDLHNNEFQLDGKVFNAQVVKVASIDLYNKISKERIEKRIVIKPNRRDQNRSFHKNIYK